MRYKISYGPDDKRDRWGHTVKPATIYTEYADTNTKAEEIAIGISREHKKWSVLLYDTQGPQEDPEDPQSVQWLMVAYKGGKRVLENSEYTLALHRKNLGLTL